MPRAAKDSCTLSLALAPGGVWCLHAHATQPPALPRPRCAEDVDFITGGGPSEAVSSSAPSQEQEALIRRRVLIGAAATAGLAAFALVPTKDLRIKPSKPLYFYLTALLRTQARSDQRLRRAAPPSLLCGCGRALHGGGGLLPQ